MHSSNYWRTGKRPRILIISTHDVLDFCFDELSMAFYEWQLELVFCDSLKWDAWIYWPDVVAQITGCDVVFYIVGRSFGDAAALKRYPLDPPRSYAQRAYDCARELEKPIFVFFSDDALLFGEGQPESVELQDLQQRHREDLAKRYLDRQFRNARDLSRQIVQDLEMLRQSPCGLPVPELPPKSEQHFHEQVQFTAYRPKFVRPGKWTKMLVFAHLEDRPAWLDEDELSPLEELEKQAERMLGSQIEDYRRSTDDSRLVVPRDGEITLIPQVDGIEFNPPRRVFLWKDGVSIHHESFDLRAASVLDGKVAGGRLTIFLGYLILAEISLSIRVDSRKVPPKQSASLARQREAAKPYRRIFASYSHRDLVIVETMERHARSLGDEYLRDWVHLRSGEIWNTRLQEMVRQADIFQLFWSSNSATSKYVENEWRYALDLKRPLFVRPTYWEIPMPPPPDQLRHIHFHRLVTPVEIPRAGSFMPSKRQDVHEARIGTPPRTFTVQIEAIMGPPRKIRLARLALLAIMVILVSALTVFIIRSCAR